MTLANYINDLLYRYDCVIVPNFGGFVTNKTGAKVNHATHTMYPPKKEVTFNAYLKHNDGLLANYMASNEKISFKQALIKIEETVTEWNLQLTANEVEIAEVGSLSLNEESQITFEPNPNSNFLQESFGLATVTSDAIKRATELSNVTTATEQEKTTIIPMFAKRAVAAAVVLGVGYLGWNAVQNQQYHQELASQEKTLEKKIQSATFVIDNPLPTINLNVSKEATKNFHIIAGAFQLEENAYNKAAQLKKQGYEAQILGKNSWGLTEVTFKSFETKEEARAALTEIKQTVSEEAWLLEK